MTYQINYTNINDEPVTVFLHSNENLLKAKEKFILENNDVEMINSCIDLGMELTTYEIETKEVELHHLRDIKDWLNIYFNEKGVK